MRCDTGAAGRAGRTKMTLWPPCSPPRCGGGQAIGVAGERTRAGGWRGTARPAGGRITRSTSRRAPGPDRRCSLDARLHYAMRIADAGRGSARRVARAGDICSGWRQRMGFVLRLRLPLTGAIAKGRWVESGKAGRGDHEKGKYPQSPASVGRENSQTGVQAPGFAWQSRPGSGRWWSKAARGFVRRFQFSRRPAGRGARWSARAF
jgi:hypothetical protein